MKRQIWVVESSTGPFFVPTETGSLKCESWESVTGAVIREQARDDKRHLSSLNEGLKYRIRKYKPTNERG